MDYYDYLLVLILLFFVVSLGNITAYNYYFYQIEGFSLEKETKIIGKTRSYINAKQNGKWYKVAGEYKINYIGLKYSERFWSHC